MSTALPGPFPDCLHLGQYHLEGVHQIDQAIGADLLPTCRPGRPKPSALPRKYMDKRNTGVAPWAATGRWNLANQTQAPGVYIALGGVDLNHSFHWTLEYNTVVYSEEYCKRNLGGCANRTQILQSLKRPSMSGAEKEHHMLHVVDTASQVSLLELHTVTAMELARFKLLIRERFRLLPAACASRRSFCGVPKIPKVLKVRGGCCCFGHWIVCMFVWVGGGWWTTTRFRDIQSTWTIFDRNDGKLAVLERFGCKQN